MYFALLAIALEVLIKTCGGATLTVSPAHTAEPLRSVSPHFISFALGENIIPPEVYIKLPATVLILDPRLPCCAGAAFSPVLAPVPMQSGYRVAAVLTISHCTRFQKIQT